MDFLKKKIEGVSILESLVAMSIILLTISLSGAVYSGIAGNKKGLKSVLMQNECERIYHELGKEKMPESRVISTESYSYDLKIKPYRESGNLLEAKISVFEKGSDKILFEYKRLFLAESNADDL